jgi:hypothetical protein
MDSASSRTVPIPPIDFFHREHTDTGFLHHFAFLRINVTDTDHDCILGWTLGEKSKM